jgi:hypothetical protein
MSAWLGTVLDARSPADITGWLATNKVGGWVIDHARATSYAQEAAAKLVILVRNRTAGARAARHYRRVLLLEMIKALPSLADAQAVKAWLGFAVKYLPRDLVPTPGDALSRPPAIGDLMQVRKAFVRAERGDYSYIENVMQFETRERMLEVHDETERFTSDTEETETTTEKDLQVSDDSRLQKETSEAAKEDLKVQAGTNVTASYGPFFQASANAAFEYSQSRESSNRSALDVSRRITERAARRVREARSRTSSLRILSESTEKNLHRFENKSSNPAVGVYRWVDKVYKAQLVNYGKRLLLEFIVPEPATSLIAAVEARQRAASAAIGLAEPLPPAAPNTFDRSNYHAYAATNLVDTVDPPPQKMISIGCTVNVPEEKGLWYTHGDTKDTIANHFVTSQDPPTVPEGYVAIKWKAVSGSWVYEKIAPTPQLWIGVGGSFSQADTATGAGTVAGGTLGNLAGKIPVFVLTDGTRGFAVAIEVECELTAEREEKWRNSVFQAAMASYNARKSTYEAARRQAASNADRQLAFWRGPEEKNREVERNELKRQVLELLIGASSFPRAVGASPPVRASPQTPFHELDRSVIAAERSRVEFMEQGVEWIHMTYTFYPYFWGRREKWESLVFSEATDPQFEQFIQAGYARVIVPVRRNFEQAALLYLATGMIWEGHQAPQIGHPLYVAASQEMLEADQGTESDAVPVGESWEVRVPTTLVALDDQPLFPPAP